MSIALFVLGLLGEFGAVTGLFLGAPPQVAAWVLLAIHGGASFAVAGALYGLLPAQCQRPRAPALGFLVSVAFFLPLLGAVGLFALLPCALRRPATRGARRSLAVALPELPYRPPAAAVGRASGEGALLGLLRHCPDPQRRLAAVMRVRRVEGEQASAILRVALRDPVDDVRLLAYSTLDRREQYLSGRIKDRLTQLASSAAGQHLSLHQRLAWDYWELAYQGLVQGEALAYALAAARRHASACLEVQKEAAATHLLLGRILLRQGELDLAADALRRAEALGMAPSSVRPYLAEAAFQQRRFCEVTEHLASLDPASCGMRPMLGAVATYWRADAPVSRRIS